MRSFATRLSAVATAALLAGLATTASAQDHQKCYKIKDPAKIKGLVDTSTLLGVDPGCKVSGAKYYCVPSYKFNENVTSNKVPVVPLPVYGPPVTSNSICYKVKCPLPAPASAYVTDQFGGRTVTKWKAAYLCTPAVFGPFYCGNGVIDAGEDCDGLALGSCTAGCRANCTCACETACCYVEQPPLPPTKPMPDAECFQYSGNPAQVAAFEMGCTGVGPAIGVPGSLVAPFLLNSAVAAACVPGPPSPAFGVPCMPGPPGAGNLHMIPSDSTCP